MYVCYSGGTPLFYSLGIWSRICMPRGPDLQHRRMPCPLQKKEIFPQNVDVLCSIGGGNSCRDRLPGADPRGMIYLQTLYMYEEHTI